MIAALRGGPVRARPNMVCTDCWPGGFEIKTKGSPLGPCCVCGRSVGCAGPITATQRDGLRRIITAAYERGRVVGFAEGAR